MMTDVICASRRTNEHVMKSIALVLSIMLVASSAVRAAETCFDDSTDFTDATALVPIIRCLDAELTSLRQEIKALKDTGSREPALFENDFLHVAVQSASRLRSRDIRLSLILTNKTANSFLLSFVKGTPTLRDEKRGISENPEIEGLEVAEDVSMNKGTEFGPHVVYRITLKFYGGRIRTTTLTFNAILVKKANRNDETGEQFPVKLTGLSVAQ